MTDQPALDYLLYIAEVMLPFPYQRVEADALAAAVRSGSTARILAAAKAVERVAPKCVWPLLRAAAGRVEAAAGVAA